MALVMPEIRDHAAVTEYTTTLKVNLARAYNHSELPDSFRIGLVIGGPGAGKTEAAMWLAEHYQFDCDAGSRSGLHEFKRQLKSSFGDNAITSHPDLTHEALAAAGLSRIPTWLRPVHILSQGEQTRATTAAALCGTNKDIVLDDYGAGVDELTVASMATSLRRMITSYADTASTRKRVLVATTFESASLFLQPDFVVLLHQSGNLSVHENPNEEKNRGIKLRFITWGIRDFALGEGRAGWRGVKETRYSLRATVPSYIAENGMTKMVFASNKLTLKCTVPVDAKVMDAANAFQMEFNGECKEEVHILVAVGLGTRALRGVGLVSGPSGCGKSTMFAPQQRMIMHRTGIMLMDKPLEMVCTAALRVQRHLAATTNPDDLDDFKVRNVLSDEMTFALFSNPLKVIDEHVGNLSDTEKIRFFMGVKIESVFANAEIIIEENKKDGCERRWVVVDEYLTDLDTKTRAHVAQKLTTLIRKRYKKASERMNIAEDELEFKIAFVFVTVHDIGRYMNPNWIWFPRPPWSNKGELYAAERRSEPEAQVPVVMAEEELKAFRVEFGDLGLGLAQRLFSPITLPLFIERLDELGESTNALRAYKEVFADHHYMTGFPPTAMKAVICKTKDGSPVAFHAIMPSAGGGRDLTQPPWQESRLVVLPTWQGFSIGPRLSEAVGMALSMASEKPVRLFATTHHPRLGQYRNSSSVWFPQGRNGKSSSTTAFGKETRSRVQWQHRFYPPAESGVPLHVALPRVSFIDFDLENERSLDSFSMYESRGSIQKRSNKRMKLE
jgi:ABC-type nitrate/sulfonate/bicarbonate transport system ATPase subunit